MAVALDTVSYVPFRLRYRLRIAQHKECQRHGVLTNHATIERISTRTNDKRWCKGKAIFAVSAILLHRTNRGRCLSGERNSHTAFNKGINGFLETIDRNLLEHAECQ